MSEDRPDPVEGFRWFRVSELRMVMTNHQIRRFYMDHPDRPRDRVIQRQRWVAVPEELAVKVEQ